MAAQAPRTRADLSKLWAGAADLCRLSCVGAGESMSEHDLIALMAALIFYKSEQLMDCVSCVYYARKLHEEASKQVLWGKRVDKPIPPSIDLQEAGRIMGLPMGESISDKILPWMREHAR